MKVLHVTFRYGREVYGGAEYYMRKLTEELHKKGIAIDICTTKTNTLTPFIKSAVLWDNTLENETIDGIDVFRFPVKNPNRYFSFLFEKIIQNRLDKEERLAEDRLIDIANKIYDERGGILFNGWNQLERYDNFMMRWTKKRAIILINDTNIQEVAFSVLNTKRINAEIVLNSLKYEEKKDLPKSDDWEMVKIDVPDVSGKLYISFKLNKTWKPLKDPRTLGIAISEIIYKTNKQVTHLNLENDYKKFLIRKRLCIDYLVSNATRRHRIYSILFDYLRGPNSPEMIKWLDRNVKRYDVIMAQMFPFNTIKYSLIAKKHNKPLVLLPLMHVDDKFYHWRHYYESLKEADMVLAISKYSKLNLFDKIGVKSVYVGAGIDREVFLNDKINGKAFKQKYNLEDKEILLTVSRKNQSKRYDQLIRAIEKIKEDFKDVHLVMIGPDEDKVPISSEHISYLGKVSEEDLIDAYDACDVFAMMSETESFGMVFCEAWARKKPVIGNINCGAVSTLIDNGVDGFLCSTVEEIIERIERLLTDKELAKKLGENGFEKVVNNYAWEMVADKVYNCYNKLIDR